MKKNLLFCVTVMLFIFLAGCNSQEKKDDGQSVTVPIGGTGYLNFKVKREKIKGPVTVTVAELPEGVEVVKDKEQKLKEDKANVTFMLQARADAPAVEGSEGTVHITGEDVSEKEKIAVNVRDFNLHTAGWIIMILSVGAVLALVTFCVYRVMTLPPVEVEETIKGPLEIDTKDTQDAD